MYVRVALVNVSRKVEKETDSGFEEWLKTLSNRVFSASKNSAVFTTRERDSDLIVYLS